jgi:hypothetical protein
MVVSFGTCNTVNIQPNCHRLFSSSCFNSSLVSPDDKFTNKHHYCIEYLLTFHGRVPLSLSIPCNIRFIQRGLRERTALQQRTPRAAQRFAVFEVLFLNQETATDWSFSWLSSAPSEHLKLSQNRLLPHSCHFIIQSSFYQRSQFETITRNAVVTWLEA